MARCLRWPQAEVLDASHQAEAFPQEIESELAESDATDFLALKRMLPQAAKFEPGKGAQA